MSEEKADTRLLMLMRHAKSDWDDPALTDHQRPLNSRGRKAAETMADWIAEHAGIPDQVLCSTAIRASETLQRMMPLWRTTPSVAFEKGLYHATPESILEWVHLLGDEAAGRLLVVGHNPGMEALASRLSREYQTFPTATVAVFEVPSRMKWGDIRWGSQLELRILGKPREVV